MTTGLETGLGKTGPVTTGLETGLGKTETGLGFETEQLSRPAIAALRHRRAGRRRAGRCRAGHRAATAAAAASPMQSEER